jgi:Protein of unknown function (DUF3349)
MPSLPDALNKVVSWLRAGYPEGVPQQDYLPLFALLGSQLSNDEVNLIGNELAFEADPASAEAIKHAITAITHTKANEADINRVRSHLAAGGWPLAHPAGA